MSNLVRPEPWWQGRKPPPQPPDPPDMDLSSRVARLESLAEKADARLAQIDQHLARMEARQDEFARHYASRADLAQAKNSIIIWVVSAVFFAQLLPLLAGLIKHFFPGAPAP